MIAVLNAQKPWILEFRRVESIIFIGAKRQIDGVIGIGARMEVHELLINFAKCFSSQEVLCYATNEF